MGGVTDRVVLDNTTIAVKQVLTGRDRVQTDAFQAFRGAYPFAAAFCAPAKGWEKGSVETGVKYVRNLVFRPRPTVASWAALNALIITELEADLATRRLADGRPVREAWTLERRHLRALPVHLPETCRVEARVVDKFGHVRADRVTYSVPTRYAYRPVWVKLYHDRVAVAAGTEVVARHVRAFRAGATVLDPFHVLPVLERKHRAVPEATALQDWPLAPVWQQVRTALRQQTRKPDQEWVRMLRLLETYPAPAVEAAVAVPEPAHLVTDLKTLCLATMTAEWRPLAAQATRERQPPAEYLAQLVHLEVTGRRERRIQRRLQEARFPMLKTLDAFQFDAQPELDRDAILQLCGGAFVAEAANVVLVGGVGTGKTHLAIALGMACCQHDYRVRFLLGLRPQPPAAASGDPCAPRRVRRGARCAAWATTA